MGLFDSVYIDPLLVEKYGLQCLDCNSYALHTFQCKDLESCMQDYWLTVNNDGDIKLYELDSPNDLKYWKEYTQEEIDQSIKTAADKGSWYEILVKKPGDGYFTKEGYKPENRQHRDLGEFPHQWIEIYTGCLSCDSRTDIMLRLKFTDGIVEDAEVVFESY